MSSTRKSSHRRAYTRPFLNAVHPVGLQKSYNPPKVMLMPHDGETFAVSLDSLEGRCRSETRELYKSEGKEELLGEGGVPESLRTWLQESRERALGEGGHQQRSQRRLREQVGSDHL